MLLNIRTLVLPNFWVATATDSLRDNESVARSYAAACTATDALVEAESLAAVGQYQRTTTDAPVVAESADRILIANRTCE